ncbi:YibE/F family protein [Candidatus Gracilibacteria bacterium]|nr:YibE/F family protein [Candidatus Gracilibacteria bacterium]
MKKILTILLLTLSLFPSLALAQTAGEFSRGEVVKILSEGTTDFSGEDSPFQKISVKIVSGKDDGRLVEVDHGNLFTITEEDKVHIGERVIIRKIANADGIFYNIYDSDRSLPMLYIFLFFIGLVIVFTKWKGVTSLLGLAASLAIIVWFIVPKIVAGGSPFVITMIGSVLIASTSLFLAHGFNKRTTIAWYSTLITLAVAILTSWIAVKMTGLSGTVDEETIYLQSVGLGNLSLQGLLLGGIIIGTLGVLDDVTTAQSATVYEIHRANETFHFKELYKRGLAVGKEHIVSLVNTLVLAYVGSSLPLLLLFSANHEVPWWATLNSEFFVEEVVRTLAGSIALVLAVPISTALAAFIFTRSQMRRKVSSK